MEFDRVLFVISAPNLSKRAQDQLQRQTLAATRRPSMLIRLEGTGTNLPQALDTLRTEGARRNLVQPLGIPFFESMLAWLPGDIVTWQGNDETVEVAIGREVGTTPEVIKASVTWMLERARDAAPVRGKPSLGKRGWQNPPDFIQHLLVCTGARCHYQDAASLVDVLRDETAWQRNSSDCLTTRAVCLFPWNQGPMVALYPKDEWDRLPDAESVRHLLSSELIDGQSLPNLLIHTAKSACMEPNS